MGINVTLAQKPAIEKSKPVTLKAEGWNKVLQLRNGNTFLFQYSRIYGLEITIFATDRKRTFQKTVNASLWDNKSKIQNVIIGLFEVNNEPVLFLRHAETLIRMRFNPVNGDIVKEEEITRLPQLRKLHVNEEGERFFIKKDKNSGAYAIIFFNKAAQPGELIKAAHFDSSHNIISAADYKFPDKLCSSIKYLDAIIDGGNRLLLCVCGNTSKSMDAQFYLSSLAAGDSVFGHMKLPLPSNVSDIQASLNYDNTAHNIFMLAQTYVLTDSTAEKALKTYYASFYSIINADSLSTKTMKLITAEKVNSYLLDTLGANKGFRGLPQQVVINSDSTFTIIAEDLAIYSNNKMLNEPRNTLLGPIGITDYRADGSEKKGIAIQKLQNTYGLLNPMYLSVVNRDYWSDEYGYIGYNSFMSFDYVFTPKGKYIIFNENEKNMAKENGQQRDIVYNTTDLSTIYYTINDDKVSRNYLFTNPNVTGRNTTAIIAASDYNEATNTYATLILEYEHGVKGKIAWVKFP